METRFDKFSEDIPESLTKWGSIEDFLKIAMLVVAIVLLLLLVIFPAIFGSGNSTTLP